VNADFGGAVSHNVVDLDATDPRYKADPYPAYAALRASAPARRITLNTMPAWLVTRYDDVRKLLADPRLSNSLDNVSPKLAADGAWVLGERTMGLDRNLLRSDPPAHTRLRRLVSKAFTPGRIEQLRPSVQEMADGLAARFLPRGEAELVSEFAFPLALMVIIELLGLPAADRDQFHRWAQMTVPRGPDSRQEEMEGYAAIRGYFVDLVARKTREPGGEDLLSALVTVRDEGQRLDEDELLGMAWLLLTAGHSTTVDLIGSGILALLRNPDQHAALRADPSLLPAAIEEMARYDGAVELGISRFTTEEIILGDVTIPGGGEVVLLAIAAADRDPDRFADPDRFQIRRAQTGHLGFGHGIHYCLGASLARMEAAIALRVLLHRCPDLSLAVDPDQIAWQVNPHLRGPAAVPVRFTPHRGP
jgi:cytochrome P450